MVAGLSLFCFASHAQNLITVQNGNTPAFYSSLDSAILHSQNGDTIYLPGGTFPLNVSINKRLHIIGVGHNPDSTLATGKTQINGNLSLINEASNGSCIGVIISAQIISGANISNYLVKRCHVSGGLSIEFTGINWSFIENIIQGGIWNTNNPASNCFFFNNIINAFTSYAGNGFTSSVFKNNIFLYPGYCNYGCVAPIKADASIFENNIFISLSYTLSLVTNSALNNNLFVEHNPGCSECWGSNNIETQPQSSIFVNQTGNSFSYDHDYHLQATCPGKNAGKDGTDIGIYGGAFPWKEGSVPPNPHIQFQDVSAGTDQNGNLNVNIKVSAQDR